MSEGGLLVPIANTPTSRATVDYALSIADGRDIHLVGATSGDTETPEGHRQVSTVQQLLERAEAWIFEANSDEYGAVETRLLGREQYLFRPDDYARVFSGYAKEEEIDTVVIDPGYFTNSLGPMIAGFETMLREQGLSVIEAPVSRPARHEQVVGIREWRNIATLFVISYGFYLLLGDPFYWFDIITGAVVAGIVAVSLGSVAFGRPPDFPGSLVRTIRFSVYVPYLIVEIIKSNIAISVVILRPSLPIDPKLTRVDTKVHGGLPLLALANSITLTPGTLTVRGNDQRLIIHTLTSSAREDLFDGRLERAVRFVFYGRGDAVIQSPRERGDSEIIEEGRDT